MGATGATGSTGAQGLQGLQGATGATGHAAEAGIAFQVVAQDANGNFTSSFSGGAFFDNKSYSSLTQTKTTDGTLLNTVKSENNGSHGVSVTASDQTLTSGYADRFFNQGYGDNTFVFVPGHGQDAISGLQVGTDHDDALSFSGADFNNDIAQVLAHTFQTQAGNAITYDPVTGDAVKLGGVTKQQLVQNQGDITYHR